MLKRFAELNSRPHYVNSTSTTQDDKEDVPHEEYQYLNLIHDIISTNQVEEGRNGMTLSIFGGGMVFSLENGQIPILTTKQLAWKTCLKELLWFIRCNTNNALLQNVGVHIWDDNASRDFLETRGLHNYCVGDLGPIYGHQWRHFNAKYSNCYADYSGQGIDQLANIIKCLKDPAERNLDLCASLVKEAFASEDYREGRTAFMEKREPQFASRHGD
jgi:thymidylate synthase